MVKRFSPQWGFHPVSPRRKQRQRSFTMVKLLPSLSSSFHAKSAVLLIWRSNKCAWHPGETPTETDLSLWHESVHSHAIIRCFVRGAGFNLFVQLYRRHWLVQCVLAACVHADEWIVGAESLSHFAIDRRGTTTDYQPEFRGRNCHNHQPGNGARN